MAMDRSHDPTRRAKYLTLWNTKYHQDGRNTSVLLLDIYMGKKNDIPCPENLKNRFPPAAPNYLPIIYHRVKYSTRVCKAEGYD